jgi:hypothetical protein
MKNIDKMTIEDYTILVLTLCASIITTHAHLAIITVIKYIN